MLDIVPDPIGNEFIRGGIIGAFAACRLRGFGMEVTTLHFTTIAHSNDVMPILSIIIIIIIVGVVHVHEVCGT
jgi:hypothetical protein